MKHLFSTLFLTVFLLSACSTDRISNFPSYKLTVNQGNYIDPEALNLLQTGMTRDQVQMLLGTPTLKDPFHSNRWDYPYTVTKNGLIQSERSLTVYFDQDILVKIDDSEKTPNTDTADTTASEKAAS